MNLITSTYWTCLGGLFLLSGPVLPGQTAAPSNSADSLAEALPVLQAKCADFNALHYREGDRIGDLIARSHGEISLGAPETPPTPAPITTAMLPEDVIYWRLGSFTPKTKWADLAQELKPTPVQGAILDLRGNVARNDFSGAAQVLGFFAPGDETLKPFFPTLTDGNHSGGVTMAAPSFHGPIIVLVNSQTTGAAEVLAACLQTDGALVMGRATPGRGAVMEEQALSNGKVLHYVSAHILLANGTDLWDHPVVPDISLTINDQAEQNALTLIEQGKVMEVIAEAARRHRLSEAALVHGDDPELNDYVVSQEKKSATTPPAPVQDVVLIGALDSLKAIRLSQRTAPAPLPAATVSNVSISTQ
jgi:hypothetical protein